MLRNISSIPMWAEDDRPREKLVTKGKGSLSDAELLAIILGTGTGRRSAVDLARELLQMADGDLHKLGKLQFSQLCSVKGIGEAKAVSVLAAVELGRRRKNTPTNKKRRLRSSRECYDVLSPHFSDLLHEEFYVLLLNRANEELAVKRVSVGGLAGTYVDAKVIFRIAVEIQASAIILAHNHPSGNLTPSTQDEALTKKLKEFGSLIDLPVLDHMIITDNGYFSFADNSLM